MADWKFTDQYASAYPALAQSILAQLAFSSHTPLTPGTSCPDFTGTLDVGASGAALGILGSLLGNAPQIDVSGSVTEADQVLTVSLSSTDESLFQQQFASYLPLVANQLTAAGLSIDTVAAAGASGTLLTDDFELDITLSVANASLSLTAAVPVQNGDFSLTGTFTDIAITLDDLNFLMGSLGSSQAWFPTSAQLAPYSAAASPSLLSLTLTANVTQQSGFAVSIPSLAVVVSIEQAQLLSNLYLDPLGVQVTITAPTTSPTAAWSLTGTANLYAYNAPDPPTGATPDFSFAVTLDLGAPFALTGTGTAANPPVPVSQLVADLLGSPLDVGLASSITIDSFMLAVTTASDKVAIQDFSTDVVLSAGFGLFAGTVEVNEISLSVSYTGS